MMVNKIGETDSEEHVARMAERYRKILAEKLGLSLTMGQCIVLARADDAPTDERHREYMQQFLEMERWRSRGRFVMPSAEQLESLRAQAASVPWPPTLEASTDLFKT